MKKTLVALCAVLPGGFILLAIMVLFMGCAYTTYNSKTGAREVKGFGSIMEIAAAEDLQANAEIKRAEASCIARRGMAACYYGNYGLVPPEEVAWKQFLSQQGGSAPGTPAQNELRKIKQEVK